MLDTVFMLSFNFIRTNVQTFDYKLILEAWFIMYSSCHSVMHISKCLVHFTSYMHLPLNYDVHDVVVQWKMSIFWTETVICPQKAYWIFTIVSSLYRWPYHLVILIFHCYFVWELCIASLNSLSWWSTRFSVILTAKLCIVDINL